MGMQQRLIASASMANKPQVVSSIASRLIATTTIQVRKITSTIIGLIAFDEDKQTFDADFTYDYSTTNGIMQKNQVSSATMKGR